MKFKYYNEEFTLDDEIIRRRKERFGDTEEKIIKHLKPFIDCQYGKNISFYVEQKGRENLEIEFNDYLTTDLDLTDPVE